MSEWYEDESNYSDAPAYDSGLADKIRALKPDSDECWDIAAMCDDMLSEYYKGGIPTSDMVSLFGLLLRLRNGDDADEIHAEMEHEFQNLLNDLWFSDEPTPREPLRLPPGY